MQRSQPFERWHSRWQSYFKNREIVIGDHRADVKLDDGCILELQHSPISWFDIMTRESEYQNMIWLLDLTNAKFELRKRLPDGKRTFRWKYPKRSFEYSIMPIYVDIGEKSNIVYHLEKVYWGSERCACAGICSPKLLCM